MTENDEKIEKLLSELPDNLDGVSFLSEKYSELAGYNMDGALASRVSEALKRIREFSEEKLKNFDAEKNTQEGAVYYQDYLGIAEQVSTEENKERNAAIRVAIESKLQEYDREEDIADVNENADIAANCEAWGKAVEGIRPFEEVTREDGSKFYRVTSGFEGLGGFFAALDRESSEELCEMAHLEAIQNLGAKNAPSDDADANRNAYIEELNGVWDQTGFQLWQEYQKQLFAEEHPELLSRFDFQAAMQLEPQLDKPEEHIKALSETEIKNADDRIRQGKPLSLTEMAGICKGRDLLNKPARIELIAVIERAAAAKNIEGSDLVALQYLLNEVERVPEYKSLAKEENLSAARRHVSGFRGNLNVYRNYQQTLQRQTVEFERNSFSNRKVFKSSLAAVICSRSAATVCKAERLFFKTKAKAVWIKIRAWDDKMTKKHSFFYPLAKSVSIGVTTGVAGLTAYSGFKLYKQIKGNYKKYKEEAAKAKAEGREFYKNYRSYFCAKENRKEAYQIGGAALLSGISVYFGGTAVAEHGIAAVTGLSGQIAQHGLGGLSNGGAALSGLWNKVTHMNWESAGEMAKSMLNNARVISSTSTSLLTGVATSMETAKEQRVAEEKLDALLREYGVAELPTDKKLLKKRSKNPAAYFAEVLKQNGITLNEEKTTQLNSVAQEVAAKRKEKNMRRWGAIGGSTVGLMMAGMFGAREDLQPTPAEPAMDVSASAPDAAPQTGIAAENRDYASMFNFDDRGDDVLLSDKLNGNRFNQDIFNDSTDFADVNTSAENGQNVDVATGANGIDLANLSDEQKHDLDMLFKRYPRAASLILEGSENPAVTDSPSNGVISSAKLQAMYESGNIPADKLEDMVKFAGEHFDAKGNFVGPDAEALNAETRHAFHTSHESHLEEHGVKTKSDAMSADVESKDIETNPVSGNMEPKTIAEEQMPEGHTPAIHTDDSNAIANGERDGQDNSATQNAEVVVSHEIHQKGINITYSIEDDSNSSGFRLRYNGSAAVDQEMLREMKNGITRDGDMYVAANGAIRSQNFNIVNSKVTMLCQQATVQNAIADQLLSSDEELSNAEKLFLKSHAAQMTKYGIEYTHQQNSAQVDVHATNAHAEITADASAGNGHSAAMLAKDENGVMTTQSGYSFSIDAKGNIVHQSVLNEVAQAQAEAEIYAALSSSKNLAANEQAFVADYARAHNIDLHASAETTIVSHAAVHSDIAQVGGNDEVKPSIIKNPGAGRSVTRDPYNNDDIYYRPKNRGNTGVTEASRDVAMHAGDGKLEDSQEVDGSQHTAHDATIVSRHRIWQYRGVTGHYSFVDTGGKAPVLDVSQLKNVPQQLDIHAHIRATNEWNGNATYEEYLGGAIRGTSNEVGPQFRALCENLDGSDVVYRDMQQRIADGYNPSIAEQKWMRGFEQDLRTIGLGYVDGKLTPVQSPQSLKAQWYGTDDAIKTSQILQARAERYNGR